MFCLKFDDMINEGLIKRIAKHNFSRVPIFDANDNCVGILLAKHLLDPSLHLGCSIRNSKLQLVPPLIISSNTNLLEALSIMEQRKNVIALISEFKENTMKLQRKPTATARSSKIISGNFMVSIIGLINLKDIFEKIVEKDFEDHDIHLKSVMSMTYYSENNASNKKRMEDTPLIEMTEPEEYKKELLIPK